MRGITIKDDGQNFLRPSAFDDFVGQKQVVENLKIAVQAARLRNEPLPHTLLSGNSGCGKTTLSNIIARAMSARLHTTCGSNVKSIANLTQTLVQLQNNDILFVDEIHRILPTVEEFLYSAMEDGFITLPTRNSQHVKITLPKFTLVGATTREGLLTNPLLMRFVITEKLDWYSVDELTKIGRRTFRLLGFDIHENAVNTVAERSRGTPRILNRYCLRIRDFAQVTKSQVVSEELVVKAFEKLGVDKHGLEDPHRKILQLLCESDRPLGVKTIATAIGEGIETIEETYEPYLVRCGLVIKGYSGREITSRGKEILNG